MSEKVEDIKMITDMKEMKELRRAERRRKRDSKRNSQKRNSLTTRSLAFVKPDNSFHLYDEDGTIALDASPVKLLRPQDHFVLGATPARTNFSLRERELITKAGDLSNGQWVFEKSSGQPGLISEMSQESGTTSYTLSMPFTGSIRVQYHDATETVYQPKMESKTFRVLDLHNSDLMVIDGDGELILSMPYQHPLHEKIDHWLQIDENVDVNVLEGPMRSTKSSRLTLVLLVESAEISDGKIRRNTV